MRILSVEESDVLMFLHDNGGVVNSPRLLYELTGYHTPMGVLRALYNLISEEYISYEKGKVRLM